MTSFVDRLLTRREEPPSGVGSYDEAHAYTVAADGRPVVELPRGESREITEVDGEHDVPPDRRDDEEDLQIETTRTFVDREDDEPSSWAHVIGRTRTETSVEREAPDRDDW